MGEPVYGPWVIFSVGLVGADNYILRAAGLAGELPLTIELLEMGSRWCSL